jgi:hypothetical protein
VAAELQLKVGQEELAVLRRCKDGTCIVGLRLAYSRCVCVVSTIFCPRRQGRVLPVPAACGGAAWFGFEDLCLQPVAAADYLAIARRFHTVFLAGVPRMGMQDRDAARRQAAGQRSARRRAFSPSPPPPSPHHADSSP